MILDQMIKSLLKLSKGMSRPVYRGQANAKWEVKSGAVRRIEESYDGVPIEDEHQLMGLIQEYQKQELIEPLKLMGHPVKSDELMLAELQHHGAATQLVDFTESPLVALWFACSELNQKEDKKNCAAGKIFVTDIGNSLRWINGRRRKWMSEDPRENPQEFVYYKPDQTLGARILAQSSLFLVGEPHIPKEFMKDMTVPVGEKMKILEQLERLRISESVLFADLPGLAKLNNANRKLMRNRHLNPNQYKRLGERAFFKMQFTEALSHFAEYANLKPQVAEPYWLKGNALAELKVYERAIAEYDKAIEFKDNPFPVEKFYWDPFFIDYNLGTYHYNRGNAHAALGDHGNAIKDFDQSINLSNRISIGSSERLIRDCNYNKANSHFVLGQFTEAYEHFKRSGQNERSDAHLGMGNSVLMNGRINKAQNCYRIGIDKEPVQATEACHTNLNMLTNLIHNLKDRPIVSSRIEGKKLMIEVKNVQEKVFEFTGNTGNYGNWGGGKGYSGLMGFAIHLLNVRDN